MPFELYVLAYYARQLWRGLPGPWPVKILLIIITQLIPGCWDELALVAVTAWWRRRKARRQEERSEALPGD